MTFRLPLIIKKAAFAQKPQKGFTATVTFALHDSADFPFPWPDRTFELTGNDASAIMETGRNGLVLASLKAEDENTEKWRMGYLTPAA